MNVQLNLNHPPGPRVPVRGPERVFSGSLGRLFADSSPPRSISSSSQNKLAREHGHGIRSASSPSSQLTQPQKPSRSPKKDKGRGKGNGNGKGKGKSKRAAKLNWSPSKSQGICKEKRPGRSGLSAIFDGGWSKQPATNPVPRGGDSCMFVCWDLETTGLNTKFKLSKNQRPSAITQIGASAAIWVPASSPSLSQSTLTKKHPPRSGRVKAGYWKLATPTRWESHVFTDQPITPFITQLTGVTPEQVSNAQTLTCVLRDWQAQVMTWKKHFQQLDGPNAQLRKVILVAHNGTRFDLPLLRANMKLGAEAALGDLSVFWKQMGVVGLVDSMNLAQDAKRIDLSNKVSTWGNVHLASRKNGQPSFTLDSLYQGIHRVKQPGRHTAGGDAVALWSVVAFLRKAMGRTEWCRYISRCVLTSA